MKVGVLAIQGNVDEHVYAMRRALDEFAGGGDVIRIKNAFEVEGCEALALPGGESTTHTKLMWESGIAGAIIEAHGNGVPVIGTCAGLVLLSRDGGEQARKTGSRLLKLLDVDVERNAYGGQVDSFEAPLDLPALGIKDFPGVFIRAPVITNAGEGVEVLGELNGDVVAVRQKDVWGLTFHPEMTNDLRIHKCFLKKVV